MIVPDFGNASDYVEQIQLIRFYAKELRQLRPRIVPTWEQPADWVLKDANIHGQAVRSLTITLTPTGCEWASNGGCTMCGEYAGSTGSTLITPMFHVAQYALALSTYVSQYQPSWIRIYQEGNYTNLHEIDQVAQRVILQLGSLIAGVRRLTVESMAKYLNEATVTAMSQAVGGRVELEVGMGFEAEDDVVRNVCVNKGETIHDYERALKLLRVAGVRSLAYVLLKPPFLSEAEAIAVAINTIRRASEMGFDAISLEPVCLHAYTLVHALSIEGAYELPWLWSIIEVARSARNVNDFRIGGVGFYPRPTCVAHNRHSDGSEGCNKKVWDAIREYGKSRDLGILERLDCDCKTVWNQTCRSVESPLRDRIDVRLSRISIERYAKYLSEHGLILQAVADHTTAIAGGTQFNPSSDGIETAQS